jgi:hypothetical protein
MMKRKTRNTLIVLYMSLFLTCGVLAMVASRYGHLSINLPIKHTTAFDRDTASYPSQLRTKTNILIDAHGDSIILQGLMPSDPAVLANKGRFKQDYFDEIADAGANVVRLAVHPERWERDPDYLWRYLDPAVAWNGEIGLYVIIELHFIGNISTNSGSEMPDISTSSSEFAISFWQQVASYFKDTPNVMFEIFNEPSGISAKDWQVHAQTLVDVIRATGAEQLILIGGIEYSRDLSWVLDFPIVDDNVAYAVHIYPGHSSYHWERWFGNVSEEYPVVMTEWGWMEDDPSGDQPYLVGSQKSFGEPLMAYLDEKGIGWVACWYDDEWNPTMFEKDSDLPTPFGQFVLDRLSGR